MLHVSSRIVLLLALLLSLTIFRFGIMVEVWNLIVSATVLCLLLAMYVHGRHNRRRSAAGELFELTLYPYYLLFIQLVS